MNLSELKNQEGKKLKDFFNQPIELPEIEISDEQLNKLLKLDFDLHYLPKIEQKDNEGFINWRNQPHQNFYDLIKKNKLSEGSGFLPGKWIFIDKRTKPKKNVSWRAKDDPAIVILNKLLGINFKKRYQRIDCQQYDNDFLLPILAKHNFSSRFCLSWQEINGIIKSEIAKLLNINEEKIRLPNFLEWNFLGNIFYPKWGKTTTWEWLNDRLKTGECLTIGCGGLNVLGWDAPDFWSTILGFRFLIEA